MTIGVVGLGSIGQRHIRNLVDLRGTRHPIVAYAPTPGVVYDRRALIGGQLVDFVKAYGIARCETESDLFAYRPDVLLVCTPTSHHVEWAHKGLDHGCHLLIEKPLAHRLTDGLYSLDRWDKTRHLHVGYQLRYHPQLWAIRQMIRQGRFGRILSADLVWHEYLPETHPWEDYRTRYAATQSLGGGVLACYSHEFDYATILFGVPDQVIASPQIGDEVLMLETDVETAVTVSWRYDQAPVCERVFFDLSFAHREPVRHLVLHGTRCSVLWDLLTNTVTTSEYSRMTWDDAGKQSRPIEQIEVSPMDRNQLFVLEIEAFVQHCESNVEPDLEYAALDDGITVCEELEAMHQSLLTGEAIEMEVISGSA